MADVGDRPGPSTRRLGRGAVRAGDLVELRVDGLDLRRSLHSVWQGRRPGPLAAELLAIAGSTRGVSGPDPRAPGTTDRGIAGVGGHTCAPCPEACPQPTERADRG